MLEFFQVTNLEILKSDFTLTSIEPWNGFLNLTLLFLLSTQETVYLNIQRVTKRSLLMGSLFIKKD